MRAHTEPPLKGIRSRLECHDNAGKQLGHGWKRPTCISFLISLSQKKGTLEFQQPLFQNKQVNLGFKPAKR
jgi:hypothetical protein